MPQEVIPFQRTTTMFNGTPQLSTGTGTTNDTTTGNHLLGNEYVVYDDTYGTGREITLRAVRNKSAYLVGASQLVQLDVTGTQILGLTIYDAQGPTGAAGNPGPIAVIDDHLIGTVAQYDICFVVVGGPVCGLTQMSNVATNVINVGDPINAVTINSTSGAVTTAGRIKTRALSSAVTAAQTENEGVFAYAVSSIATSGQTNTAVLIDIVKRVG